MAKVPPCCFRLEVTRGPHTGSTHFYCSISHSSSSSGQSLSIGRKKCCWLRLPKDLEVSSVHAEFRFVKAEGNETRLGFCDVKSSNGTKINGKMLKTQQEYSLSDGDLIAVGKTSLRFVQVGHGQPCREEGVNSATTSSGNTILTPSTSSSSSVIQSAAAPMVIELDDEETVDPVLSPLAPAFARTSGTVSTVIEPSDTPAEPDIEPDHERLKSVKNVVVIEKDMDNSRKERGDNVELKATTTSGENNAGVVDELTPEEATCTACSTVIGQLDVLQQQVHLNECIGGRVTITTANVAAPFTASTVKNDAKTKTRKRGNGGSGATRTRKPRKPKTCDNDDSIAAVPKTKRTRKRKRVDTGGDIVLALALTDASKIDKEQQTDLQLAGTKKKIEELDEQMAKLAKRRVNLVKTLSRLEKTKEKLRKSQVLPPAKVLKLLDLKTALNVIFPNNRQVHPWDQRVYTKQTERSSVVAMRYTPLRWSESSKNVDCDESKHAELAAVAAISMWKRASQQLFGLQRDSLLYRNSVLRAFLGGDENAECGGIDTDGSVDMENSHNVDNEDTDTNFEREAEYEGKSELVPVLSDYTMDWTRTYSEVPDVVKQVFPNWQRDLEFLRDQPAEEIKMALNAMNDAQAEADAMVIDNNEQHDREGCSARMSPRHVTTGSDTLSGREEQRLACKFMAQVMKQLIVEKRQRPCNDEAMQQQQTGMNLVGSEAEECQQLELQSVIDVSENEVDEELYNRSRQEQLPKAVPANGDDIVQCDA